MKPVHVRLADPLHRMPHPMNPAIDFPADGETVDTENPVWMHLIHDGSLCEAPQPKKAKEKV